MAQSMTPIGLAALKSREGVRLKAYRDSVGVPTIGWGHTAGVKMGDEITLAQASAFLDQDIDTHAAPILAAIKIPLADHEQDALVSIAFNIGVNGFRKSTFLKRLNAGDRVGCAKAIMSWTKPPEITSRREAERDQFLTPYEVRLPKARSNDAGPVKGVSKPGAAKPAVERAAIPAGKWAEDVLPPFEIRAIQARLVELGWQIVGVPDGIWGTRTIAAVKGLQEQAAKRDPSIVPDGHYGPQTKILLADPANKAPISAARQDTTAGDLAKIGTPGVVQGRRIKWASLLGALSALVGAAYSAWQAPAELPMGSSIALAFLPPWVAAMAPFLFTFLPLAYTALAGNGLVGSSVERFREGIDNTGLPPTAERGPGGLFGSLFGKA